jgi:Spy/CpxP family protein refolding chaperone
MSLTIKILYLAILSIFSNAVFAQDEHRSPYAGQEKRAIKSLSGADLDQLRNGKGWGLAKAAELNGMPGPSHLLQMREEISLSPEQAAKIQALYDDMKAKAIPLGNRYVALEKELNDAFAARTITKEQLAQRLDAIADVHKELRYVHLVTHLMTPDILTPQQIAKYNQLRGYGSANPCDHVPKGHDPAMWRMHNGCQ